MKGDKNTHKNIHTNFLIWDKLRILANKEVNKLIMLWWKDIEELLEKCHNSTSDNTQKPYITYTIINELFHFFKSTILKKKPDKQNIYNLNNLYFIETIDNLKITTSEKFTEEHVLVVSNLLSKEHLSVKFPAQVNKNEVDKLQTLDTIVFTIKSSPTFLQAYQRIKEIKKTNSTANAALLLDYRVVFGNFNESLNHNWPLFKVIELHTNIFKLALSNKVISTEEYQHYTNLLIKNEQMLELYSQIRTNLSTVETKIIELIEKSVNKESQQTNEMFLKKTNKQDYSTLVETSSQVEPILILKQDYFFPRHTINVYSNRIILNSKDTIADIGELKKLTRAVTRLLKIYDLETSLELKKIRYARTSGTDFLNEKTTSSKTLYNLVQNKGPFELTFIWKK